MRLTTSGMQTTQAQATYKPAQASPKPAAAEAETARQLPEAKDSYKRSEPEGFFGFLKNMFGSGTFGNMFRQHFDTSKVGAQSFQSMQSVQKAKDEAEYQGPDAVGQVANRGEKQLAKAGLRPESQKTVAEGRQMKRNDAQFFPGASSLQKPGRGGAADVGAGHTGTISAKSLTMSTGIFRL